MVELAVRARAHLVAHRGLKVHEHGAGHVLAGARLREEGVEGVIAAANGLVRGHPPIGLNDECLDFLMIFFVLANQQRYK